MFKARLGALGYEVVELNLLKETVPPEVALLAVVGPKVAVQRRRGREAESGGRRRQAPARRGRGPGVGGREDRARGVLPVVQPGDRIERHPRPGAELPGPARGVYAPIVGLIHHPIVDSLTNRAVLMPRASPITILTAAAERQAGRTYNQAVLPTAILRTSDASWGETDLASKKLERNDKDEPRSADRRRRRRPTGPSRRAARSRSRAWSSSPAGSWPTTCFWSKSRRTSTC